MNKWLVSAMILIVAGAAAYFAAIPISSERDENDRNSSGSPNAERRVTPIDGELQKQDSAVGETSDRKVELIDRLVRRGIVNEMYAEFAALGEADESFQEQFFVLGRGAASRDEGCFPIDAGPGTHDCWNDYAFHPYFAYELDDLRQLSSTDATAAAVLGVKLMAADPTESLQYRVQAARQSEKPGPLVSYLRVMEARIDPVTTELSNTDDVLTMYAVALAVDHMGYPYMLAQEYEALLSKHNVPDDELQNAVAESQKLIAQIGGP